MKRNILTLVVVVLAGLLTLASCKKEPSPFEKISGSWTNREVQEFTLRDGGSSLNLTLDVTTGITFTDPQSGTVTVTAVFLEEGIIPLTTLHDTAAFTYTFDGTAGGISFSAGVHDNIEPSDDTFTLVDNDHFELHSLDEATGEETTQLFSRK